MERIIFVDGFAIRNSLDLEFSLLHRRSTDIRLYAPKFYIPLGEVWIDHLVKDEADFLMMVDAFTDPTPSRTYQELRQEAKTKFRPLGAMPEHVLRNGLHDGHFVRYVDGSIVRRYLDPEFVFGGHSMVYDYIPEGEIWIDAKMDPDETGYTLHHESLEYDLMSQGKSYAVAHEYAIISEKEIRRIDGNMSYPGDDDYPWCAEPNDTIITKCYMVEPQAA